MKVAGITTVACCLASAAQAHAVPEAYDAQVARSIANVHDRALPNSPNGYTPTFVDCPSNNAPSIRSASSLSPNESSWLQLRRNNTIQPMRELLSRLNVTGFDTNAYLDRYSSNTSTLPNIALAFSGGGWRALMNGAGAIKAWDSRTSNTTAAGQLGGLLQSATYIAGISGGNWLVGSIYANNFSTVSSLQSNVPGSAWQFGNSIIEGPEKNGLQILNTAEYLDDIVDALRAKAAAGFNVTITDLWGRALSYQLINATAGGPSYTWSSIALTPGFQNASQPFPISVADNRNPNELVVSVNASVFEFNPFEMGSWDPTYFGFMPTQYLGTNMTAGQVTQNARCVVGFDNCGYVMGTSSSLFNQFLLQFNTTAVSTTILANFLRSILNEGSETSNDIAIYAPNPFYGWNPGSNPSASQQNLTLCDGGEDLQNIPFDPLIQPIRHVDVIFAIDSSADTNTGWPNGTSLVATYQRSLASIANGTGFPSIPDQNTFINLGLSNRPSFFGCNASNITQGTNVPLVVYLANSPYSAWSNISTFQLETNNTQRDAIIENGVNIVTMGNATIDKQWPACVACAILSRSMTRTGTTFPDICNQCFSRYCWDGTVNSTTPNTYDPPARLTTASLSSGAGLSHVGVGSWTALTVVILASIILAL